MTVYQAFNILFKSGVYVETDGADKATEAQIVSALIRAMPEIFNASAGAGGRYIGITSTEESHDSSHGSLIRIQGVDVMFVSEVPVTPESLLERFGKRVSSVGLPLCEENFQADVPVVTC